MSTATVTERIEVARDILVKVAERESYRMEACPHMRPGPQDMTKALKAATKATKEIGELLASYRKLTPVFNGWEDTEVLAALALTGCLFTSQMSFRDSSDFASMADHPVQVLDLLDSFRQGRLRAYSCLAWGGRHWDIEVLQPDALVAMVVGD